ncbi:MAG: hypothetical protein AAF669_05000 [Pseudomonadota bacterium]
MIEDTIVEEIRRGRQEHAAQYNYDLEKIVAALRAEQEKSGRKIVSRGPRLIA